MDKHAVKEKVTSLVHNLSEKDNHLGMPKKTILLICILICLPVLFIFFKVFVGLAAILFGGFFVLLALFFLSPEIVKSLARSGILHAKSRGYVAGERKYLPFDPQNDGILLNLEQSVSSVTLKAMKARIEIVEHDDPYFKIKLSAESDLECLTFFTHYDEVTSCVTIDQGPTDKSVKSVPYSMRVFLPRGHKIRIFSARIIEGALTTQNETMGEQPIEILELDVLNTVLSLENTSIPILRINGLNLVLESKNIFIRYFYINAAGSQVNLDFDRQAADFSGKIKCHGVLSDICLNNENLSGLSGSAPVYLWGDKDTTRSVMLSVNLLRTGLNIRVPEAENS